MRSSKAFTSITSAQAVTMNGLLVELRIEPITYPIPEFMQNRIIKSCRKAIQTGSVKDLIFVRALATGQRLEVAEPAQRERIGVQLSLLGLTLPNGVIQKHKLDDLQDDLDNLPPSTMIRSRRSALIQIRRKLAEI